MDPNAIAAWIGAILSLLLVTLRLIAPRTKATWDDRLLARLEAIEGVIGGPPPAPQPTGKSGPLSLLLVLLVGGLALQTACANPKVKAAEHVAIVCGKESAPSVAAELARWGATIALAGGKIDWSSIEADAIGAGSVIGGCAVHEFTAALKATPRAQLATLTASATESPVTTAEALLAKLSAGWGGATWTVEP